MATGKILIVDDDTNICELLRLYIEKEGYEASIANDGETALKMFDSVNPDLVLLDIMLPGLDGWQVCREIRKKSSCPIIMLTAKGEVFDKVLGLELGADDYVVKPFETKEVVARINAVLRRAGRGNVMQAFDVVLDAGEHTVLQNGRPVELTPNEFLLLEQLMRNRGAALYRDTLYERVWGGDRTETDTRTLDLHIMRLRRKLHWYDHIETVYRIGYRLKKE